MLLGRYCDRDEFISLAEKNNVVPVGVEILADMETPVSLLDGFYDRKGPAFLLESVEGGERWGRYSFMGTSAWMQVRVFRNNVEVREDGETRITQHEGDPLGFLKRLMSRFKPASVAGLPRFWGGLVGHLNYEMISFFEKIPNDWPDEKPMAQFIIPDELLIFDNTRHSLILLAICFLEDGNGDPGAVYDAAVRRLSDMMEMMGRGSGSRGRGIKDVCYDLTPRWPLARYPDMVRAVKHHIREGDVIQTVVAQPFECKSPPDILSLYRAQRYVNPSPYLFFIHIGATALVGSSPETMVRLENRVATLRPIAGTRPRGATEQEDRALASELLADEKERAEHLMLVDLGRNDLGRVAETGSVQVTDLMLVERYSHVMHLVSNICADMRDDCDAWDLLAASFPAGTLSGAPKIRAMEIIADLEKEPRGPYGGAVGYISFSGNMDLAITIRTACIEEGVLTVRAGAGIVADSDPETERMETVNKSKAIEKALQLCGGRLS